MNFELFLFDFLIEWIIDGLREYYAKWNKSDREQKDSMFFMLKYLYCGLKNIFKNCILKNRNRFINIGSKLMITSEEKEEGRGNIGEWE